MDPDAFAQLQADFQAAQAQIQALLATQAAGGAQAATQFALTPALTTAEVIDYSTSAGSKIYKAAVAPLDTLFNGTAAGLALFLSDVKDRANNFGWNGILTISDQKVPTTNRNLITQHRMLMIDNVHAAALAYLGLQNQAAQNSHQLFEFLKSSLNEETRKAMMNEHEKFVITRDGTEYQDGPSFLKAILAKCHVETNATNFYLRETLLNLPAKMTKLSDKVDSFNDYIKMQVADLAASRGHSTDFLLVYLFKSYLSVKDCDFNDYIKHKKEAFDEGSDISANALMDAALTKYRQIVQSGQWCAQSEEEKKLVALAAKLQQYKDTISKMKMGSKDSDKASNKSNKSSTKSNKSNKSGEEKSWRKQKPKSGQKTHTVKGKTYKWCDHHGYWGNHDTTQCRAMNKKDTKPAKSDSEKTETSSNNKPEGKKSLELARALVAISEEKGTGGLHNK